MIPTQLLPQRLFLSESATIVVIAAEPITSFSLASFEACEQYSAGPQHSMYSRDNVVQTRDRNMKKTRIRPHTIKFGFSFNFSEFENRYRSMEVSLSLPCHFRGAIGRQNVLASLQHLGTIASGTTTQL